MSLLAKAFERRSASLASTLEAVGRAPRASVGPVVNTETAMRLSTVWGCVRLICETIAGLPIDVYRRRGSDRVEVLAPALIRNPSGLVSPITWRYQLLQSLVLTGNAFGLIVARDVNLYPTQIELVSPKNVWVRQRTQLSPPEYRIGNTTVDAADVFHVAAHNLPGSVLGLSPIAHARETLGAGLAATSFGEEWWSGGGHPTGLLASDQVIDKDQAKEIKARFKAATAGDKLAVLGAGLHYEALQVSPKDSGWLDAIQATDEQICRFFGVPPEAVAVGVSGQNITYANREQRSIDLLVFTMQWWISLIEEALSAQRPRDEYIKHNVDALLRSDAKTRTDIADKRLRVGLTNRNYERALMDEPPIDGGDEYLWPPVNAGRADDDDGGRDGSR